MQIVDLSPEHEHAWLHCLEPGSEEVLDGVARKRQWYAGAKDQGLIVKLAIDDDGEVAGMVQAVPIEMTQVVGETLHFIQCVWVHGHKEGIGDRQGRGLGTQLLEAVEQSAREAGAQGMAAWGMALPFWMKASWFKKHGYAKADRSGISVLVWKPFTDAAEPPRWPTDPVKPEPHPEGVTLTCLDSGWCTLQSANCARARRAAEAEGVRVRDVDTSDPEIAARWRQDYGLYVDGKAVRMGPPLKEDKVRKKIRKAKGKRG